MLSSRNIFKAFFVLFYILNASVLVSLPESSTVKITFYYDGNLNGIQEAGEPILSNLEIHSEEKFHRLSDGAILVLENQKINFHIKGISPNGKALTIATFNEPSELITIQDFTLNPGKKDQWIGLSDGFLTAPIRPEEMNLEDYKNALKDPVRWKDNSDKFYPSGWSYSRNYFYFGYRIPEGGLAGTPHLAFDLWALPGTAVLASGPGIVVKPLFDWKFGIQGPLGTVYYNHLIPKVAFGEKVNRYDVVGYVAEGQGNHLHFEIYPHGESLLTAFPGVGREYLLKSPLDGASVPSLPFFEKHQ